MAGNSHSHPSSFLAISPIDGGYSLECIQDYENRFRPFTYFSRDSVHKTSAQSDKRLYQSPLILTELFQHNLINVSYLTAC